ncbi:hypothetical protein JCM19039_889 [Geomicrobium sp. JCM 19039]|nr:DUF2487 family protein [Geomicrobium sp. JCM 19039]GAK11208.1 hypothetical protein JCM19039_889 [Geomicrobium sp. JCM 19039]
MRWQTTDVDTYQQSKAYVDTILVPLVPVSLDDEMRSKVAMGEYISLITMEMEKQFRGRLLQLPPLMYPSTESEESIGERLSIWVDEFRTHEVKHVIWLTSDPRLKKLEDVAPGLFIMDSALASRALGSELSNENDTRPNATTSSCRHG